MQIIYEVHRDELRAQRRLGLTSSASMLRDSSSAITAAPREVVMELSFTPACGRANARRIKAMDKASGLETLGCCREAAVCSTQTRSEELGDDQLQPSLASSIQREK